MIHNDNYTCTIWPLSVLQVKLYKMIVMCILDSLTCSHLACCLHFIATPLPFQKFGKITQESSRTTYWYIFIRSLIIESSVVYVPT